MKENNQGKIILALSLPLSALVIGISCIGIFTPGFYSGETLNWQVQSLVQDKIDLFLVTPCLILSALFSFRGNRTAMQIWGGVVLYLTYTFVIYCFDIHFNRLFVFYCLALGLSFYSILYYLFAQPGIIPSGNFKKNYVTNFTGIYFLVISVMFYFLWLSEIIPAMLNDTAPESLVETGLLTNPVQVIDLSVFLPAIFITGILLLKRKRLGFILAPVMLAFFILMDITLAFMTVEMKNKGLDTDLSLTVMMSILALFSLILLTWFFRSIEMEG